LPRPRKRRAARTGLGLLVSVLLVFLALAWWLERSSVQTELGATLRERSVSSRAFGAGGALRRALLRMDMIHPNPPETEAVDPSGFELDASAASRPVTYALERLPRDRVAGALRIHPRWLERDVAVVSLLMRPSELSELVANRQARGRASERRGYLGYVENGEHLFGSYVGVRLHGGWSRGAPVESLSYRIYLRKSHGYDRFQVPLIPGREEDFPSELVIRNDGQQAPDGEIWYFRSPICYDIARRIGCPAPHTRPALLFINGVPMGLRALTEFLQRDYLRARFGIEEPTLVRTKRGPWDTVDRVREGDREAYDRFVRQARDPRIGIDWVRANVDVDNLYRWFLAVLFCSTDDPFQGTLVRDEGIEGARWFWIAWDMDGSFVSRRLLEAPWQSNEFSRLTTSRDPRSSLLRRLLADPGERRTFLELANDALDHGLTDEFLEERWRHYRDIAEAYGVEDETRVSLAKTRLFLRQRKEVLREQLARRLAG
jgi:hypothetical protein